MKSIAHHHFPEIIRKSDGIKLFNPVLKKRFANRPEERVRLQWVEYLLYQTDWKNSRIGFEAPVKLHREERALRADLVLYQKNMQPFALIECKSESVALNRQVAEQAARYNSQLQAPYLALTNGLHDFWFERIGRKLVPCNNPVMKTESQKYLHTMPQYWESRGFASSTSDESVRNWLRKNLPVFFKNEQLSRFLDFKTSFLPFWMSHYYRVVPVNDHDNEQMALGFLGEKGFDSYLVAVLNQKGVNRGVLTVNLDRLMGGNENSATLYSNHIKTEIDARKAISGKFFKGGPEMIEKIPAFLRNFFD